MSADTQAAIEYLLGPVDVRNGLGPLWRWEDHGRVVVWRDGTTIAFREELEVIFERLSWNGLPPFLSILLILSATRDSWPELRPRLCFWLEQLSKAGEVLEIQQKWIKIEKGLERVQEFRDELRPSPSAKSDLANLAFQNSTERTSPSVAGEVLFALNEARVASYDRAVGASDLPPDPRLSQVLSALADGLERLDREGLALWCKTGLEVEPEPAEVEIPPGERVRSLLAEIQEDDELGGIAKLAQSLMAAVTLPRTPSDPDELPQGGVSDLTNRGPLDRLLLSELAQDDLTLAVRIATGSALYWRRERPPDPKPRQRAVFLDAGLRAWGVPRVFATAVALALGATANKDTALAWYRARGEEALPVDLTTRNGLHDHLAALETDLHPGLALPAFAQALTECERESDAVLILSEDVLADRVFQRALSDSALPAVLIATLNREGNFTLHARSGRGTRVVREAKLDLELLYQSPKKKITPLIDPDKKRDEPAIFGVKPFPLRIPATFDPNRMARVAGLGVLSFTRDRRLLLYDDPKLGPVQLADNLPPGSLIWHLSYAYEKCAFAVVGELSDSRLWLVRVVEGTEVKTFPLDCGDISCRGVSYHGFVFTIHRDHVQGFNCFNGEKTGSLSLHGFHWTGGRFFKSFSGVEGCTLHALSGDGMQPRMELIASERKIGATVNALFDRAGEDGPIAVLENGNLYGTASLRTHEVAHVLETPVTFAAVSRSAERVAIVGRTKGGGPEVIKVIDVATGKVETGQKPYREAVEQFRKDVRVRSLRVHFLSVGVDLNTHSLVLISRSRQQWRLHLKHVGLFLTETNDTLAKIQPFLMALKLPERGFLVWKAEWPDGSVAYLDSRGLLHLRSADRSIPEISIVLPDNGYLAGWCADGTAWGSIYFTGDVDNPSRTRHVYQKAIEPFVKRLP